MSKKIIFCFTFAGGTTTLFNELASELDNQYEVFCFDYPGHGNRHNEKLCEDFHEVIDDLYPRLVEYLKKSETSEYALLGYSMGCIASFAMLQRISLERIIPLPEHIFLAAHEPITKARLLDVPQDRIDDYVRERTIAFQAVPEKLITNNSFWRMYLPIYKADYLMIAKYDFEKEKFETKVPCTVFYSEEDTRFEDMQNWTNYFVQDCIFVEYKGSHFFIKKYYNDMAKVIRERLM